MRLINTSTLKIDDFVGSETPPYAILSHTWENEEVSFQEFQSLDHTARQKSGYQKILKCIELAASRNMHWVWIDTCCIDKTSSAELTEAINSMYSWYRLAQECYVYLVDIAGSSTIDQHGIEPLKVEFRSSRWFRRGWTLQELIAPRTLLFFNQTWSYLGSKTDLLHDLHRETNISIDILRTGDCHLSSIAHRMSWAARRETTRVEDIAYCLMGIFDVNMPLLYGEGRKSFQRLQEEIMRTSDDQTIFTWRSVVNPNEAETLRGLLPESPSEFRNPPGFFQHEPADLIRGHLTSNPYIMTNSGLRISIELRHLSSSMVQDLYLGKLQCSIRGGPPLAIFLKRLHPGADQFARVHHDSVIPFEYPIVEGTELSEETSTEVLYVRQPSARDFKLAPLQPDLSKPRLPPISGLFPTV